MLQCVKRTMMKRKAMFVTVFLAFFLLSLSLICCAGRKSEPEEMVDFSGIWMREDDAIISTISIEQDAKGVKFGWKQVAKDGSWAIECNDAGDCYKIQGGEKVERYTFSSGLSEDGKRLVVNCLAKNLQTNAIIPFTDEIEMVAGGKGIVSRPITFDSSGNRMYTGEEYHFSRKEYP